MVFFTVAVTELVGRQAQPASVTKIKTDKWANLEVSGKLSLIPITKRSRLIPVPLCPEQGNPGIL